MLQNVRNGRSSTILQFILNGKTAFSQKRYICLIFSISTANLLLHDLSHFFYEKGGVIEKRVNHFVRKLERWTIAQTKEKCSNFLIRWLNRSQVEYLLCLQPVFSKVPKLVTCPWFWYPWKFWSNFTFWTLRIGFSSWF